MDHPHVAEAAVIGFNHKKIGHPIAAFVTIKDGTSLPRSWMEEIKGHVKNKNKCSGAALTSESLAADLPSKTGLGGTMRRLLRDIAEGQGDTTTLADPAVVATLKEKVCEEE